MTEKKPLLLIIDDEESILKMLKESLEDENYRVQTLIDGNKALDTIGKILPDLILLDIFMPNCSGIKLLEKIKKEYPQQKVIMISGFGNISIAIDASKKGAIDFIEKPLNLDEILTKISFLKEESNLKSTKNADSENLEEYGIIGQSYLFQELVQQIKQVAFLKFPLIIYGHHGTGKTLFVKFIQKLNNFNDKEFHIINSSNLQESAISQKIDLAFSGKKGILFIKNIENLSLKLQKQILFEIEEESNKDLRIMASSCDSLYTLTSQNRFNKDLFYKLNTTPIEIPALNKRRYDIPLLVDYFLKQSNTKYKKSLILNNQSIRFLRNHNWQGNISELKAIIQKIVCSTTNESEIITPEILAEFLPEKNLQIIEEQSFYRFNSLKEATEEFEKQFLIYQLKKNHHDIAQLSNVLNLTTLQLRDKMLKFNIKYKI